MKDVAPNLYVGTIGEAHLVRSQQEEWRLVNVAKTLHYALHGWSTRGKYANHPYYVIHEEPDYISVNWVDGPAAYFNYQNKGVSVTKQIISFIEKHAQSRKILITCDQGISRSPSIAMIYMAKSLHTISDTSFFEAKKDFLEKYPSYQPGQGISEFLTEHWNEI
jgi:protein-tyrosine phosphatase